MKHDETLSAYHFYVEIDGIETARFQKCVGLEAETSVFEIEEGGYGIRKFPGRTRFPNIILEKGITENNELFKWYKATVLEGRTTERKNGSVVLKNLNGEEIKRWNFFRALPCRWTGPRLNANRSGEYVVERIEIAHEGLEVDNDSTDNFPFHVGRDMSNNINPVNTETAQNYNSQTVAINPQTAQNEEDYHCDIMAYNAALNNNLDPRDQNGNEWDGNALTVSEIYERYPNNRTIGLPPENTAGYAFYDSPTDGDEIPEHMEFYDNRNTESGYTLNRTNGIDNPVPEQRTQNDPCRTFIPLDTLPTAEETQ